MVDQIVEIGVEEKLLYVRPATKRFPFVYREALGVSWSEERSALTMAESPYGDWPLRKCFEQILTAALEQGCQLQISSGTKWVNVPDALKAEILAAKVPPAKP